MINSQPSYADQFDYRRNPPPSETLNAEGLRERLRLVEDTKIEFMHCLWAIRTLRDAMNKLDGPFANEMIFSIIIPQLDKTLISIYTECFKGCEVLNDISPPPPWSPN